MSRSAYVTLALLFAAIFVGVVNRDSNIAQAQNEAAANFQWEYTTEGDTSKIDIAKLNELGKQGWELVSSVAESHKGHNAPIIRHVFKRKLQ